MDLYRSDSTFRKVDIVDDYESLIWTDRYSEAGAFELKVPWSESLATDLRTFKYLRQSESTSIMMIETAFLDRPSENLKENLVKITGRSLEAVLENRANTSYTPGGGTPVIKTGTRAAIANDFVDEMCVTSGTATNNYPNLSIYGTVPSGPTETLTIARGPLYPDILQAVLEPVNLGFRINGAYYVSGVLAAPGSIRFEVYSGVDRTINTPGVEYIEFSPDADSLTDISTLESVANYKNHARILGAKTVSTVYLPGVLTTIAGFERRTIYIDASDIGTDSTTTVAEDQVALQERGLKALLSPENKYQLLVDGDASLNDQAFKNAGLGDIVWARGSNNIKNKVRITEKIWTSDSSGEKRLPTFEAV